MSSVWDVVNVIEAVVKPTPFADYATVGTVVVATAHNESAHFCKHCVASLVL